VDGVLGGECRSKISISGITEWPMISRIPRSKSRAHAPLVRIFFSEDLSVYYYVCLLLLHYYAISTIRLQSSRSPLSIATRAASRESRVEWFVLPCIRRMTTVDPCVLGVSPKEAHQSITRYPRFSAWKMCRGGEGGDSRYHISNTERKYQRTYRICEGSNSCSVGKSKQKF
jgi:hypothetical protein